MSKLSFIQPHIGIYSEEVEQTAKLLCAHGKGILAADESTATIGKRFAAINVKNTEENRRKYRQLLFETKDIEKSISGVIMYEESLEQCNAEGIPFPQLLRSKGILVGIKVDRGAKPLYGTRQEVVSQGLDDLDERCQRYFALGARFAKWRAIFIIKDTIGSTPSDLAIRENAMALARYASICQANGLTPIVEPEVLMEGDFSIHIAAEATERVLSAVYRELVNHHVCLEGTVLKPNMVRSGAEFRVQALPEEIALMTHRVIRNTVPTSVPGIFFLSGGMHEEEATMALDRINRVKPANECSKHPWRLSFSFGRALQQSCLKGWAGDDNNIASAQAILLNKTRINGLASEGIYESSSSSSEQICL